MRRVVMVLLAFAAAAGLGACAHHEAPVVSTAFAYTRNQIVLDADIESRPGKVLLDCALDPSLVEASLARDAGLLKAGAVSGEGEGGGDGAGLAISPVIIRRLTIEGHEFGPFDALAADLSPFSRPLGEPLSGALGYSFFKDRVVRIDYASRRVEIAAARAALPPRVVAKEYTAPLVFMSGEDLVPVVDVAIGGKTFRMSVDTGSSLGVQLYETAAADLGLEAGAGSASSVVGARGAAEIRNATVGQIDLGPFSFREVPVSLSKRAHNADERVGNLGNRFLENFVVTFDYVEGSITFAQ